MPLQRPMFPVLIHTKILVFLLSLMFIDYAGYGHYVFYLSFIYLIIHKVNLYIDKTFLLVWSFGFCYALINFFNTASIGYGTEIIFLANYPCLYLIGKYLARHNTEKGMVYILYILVFSLATISLLTVLKNVQEYGFLSIERNLSLIGINNKEGYTAATGISTRLILLTSFLAFLLVPFEKKGQILFVVGGALAFYCALRVQSRTTVVSVAFVLLLSIIFNWKSMSRKQLRILFFGLFLLGVAVYYVLVNYSDQLGIIDRFQSDEIETGGGRMELLLRIVSNLGHYPWGNMGTAYYAHNLWIDCARVTGFIPLILLLIMTGICGKDLYCLLKAKKINYHLRFTIIILFGSLLMAFFSEPVLEGIPMLFAFFCLLFGVVKEYSKLVKYNY